MSITDIILIVWLLILTVIIINMPGHFREIILEQCQGTAKVISDNISDWFRNHNAKYKHEPAEDPFPTYDREAMARRLMEVHMGDINPKTGMPYKTPKNAREAQKRYRNKKQRSKK